MTIRPLTVWSLIRHWGAAYIVFYARDRWLAMRRDDGFFFAADTLAQLETEIEADYQKNPVCLDAGDGLQYLAEYLGEELAEHFGLTTQPGSPADEDEGIDQTLDMLRAVRQQFPLWRINYSWELRTWSAQSGDTKFHQPSLVVLIVGMARIEARRQKRDIP